MNAPPVPLVPMRAWRREIRSSVPPGPNSSRPTTRPRVGMRKGSKQGTSPLHTTRSPGSGFFTSSTIQPRDPRSPVLLQLLTPEVRPPMQVPVSAVTFDAGQTLIELDTAMLAQRLGERGIAADAGALEAALPGAWRTYDALLAAGRVGHGGGGRATNGWKALMDALLAGAG